MSRQPSKSDETLALLTAIIEPEIALTKNVWIVMKPESLAKREAAETALDMGPSNKVIVDRIVGSKELAMTTRSGAASSKSGTNAGKSIRTSSTTFTCFLNPSTEDSVAINDIGIVHKRQSPTVIASDVSFPICKDSCVLDMLIQLTAVAARTK